MKFCDEGFNDTDANQLASFVNAWSQIVRHFFFIDQSSLTLFMHFRCLLILSGVFHRPGATSLEMVHQQEFSNVLTFCNKNL